VLDIAGGTGDLALAFAKKVGTTGQVVHTDINEAMLRTGRDRLLDEGVALPTLVCDAEKLPFADKHFDVVSVAFGLRNMTHKDVALAEMNRVLKPGGKLLVLEFSKVAQAAAKGLRLVFVQCAAPAWASWWRGTTQATATWPSPSACTRARKNSRP
jgi:demethylmenaquinone methyltransferase/2-methoxy-6-polyprenyl-1,4-benzoquinol methylase